MPLLTIAALSPGPPGRQDPERPLVKVRNSWWRKSATVPNSREPISGDQPKCLSLLVGGTGLEPVTSAVW